MTGPVVKTFAQFDGADNRRGPSVEITDVQQAVDYGIKNGCSRFRIYEQAFRSIDGKTMTDEPEYKPGSYKLFIDNIMTAADIVAYYDQRMAADRRKDLKLDIDARIDAQVNGGMRDHFKTFPANKIFYDNPFGRGKEYCSIEAGDVVFNRAGQQLWPVVTPSVAVDHAVTPMKKLRFRTPKP